MWKLSLWRIWEPKILPQGLWKKVVILTFGCGEFFVVAVKRNPLFHINFLYGCYYYLNLSLNIFILHSLSRKEHDYAFYL